MSKNQQYSNTYLTAAKLKKGEHAFISEIVTTDSTKLQKLMSFGLVVGEEIEVIQKYPAIIISVGFTQVAVDERIASCIRVEKNMTHNI